MRQPKCAIRPVALFTRRVKDAIVVSVIKINVLPVEWGGQLRILDNDPMKKSDWSGSELFAHRVLAWFDVHGRKDLPWQQELTPYRVWVSEIHAAADTGGDGDPLFRTLYGGFSPA